MITASRQADIFAKKTSWETMKLSDLCLIDPSRKELNGIDINLDVSFGMMADLGEHVREFTPKETKKISEVTKGGYSYFKNEDVLLAKMTPCFENGKSGIALNLENGIGFGSTEFYVLRSNGKILPDLIYHVISSDKFLNDGQYSLVGTTGRRRLLKQFVESYEIPVPPPDEQARLVGFFQSVEQSIIQVEAQEINLRSLQKTLSNGLVSDPPIFGNLLSKKVCKPFLFSDVVECVEEHDRTPLENGLTRFIGLENIEPENFSLQGFGNIENGTTFTKRFAKGDVLFGKRRAYLKKVAITDFDGVCSSDILVFRAIKEKILTELLPFYVSSDSFMKHAVTTSAGSLSPRTKWRDLAGFQLSIPDIKTQEKMVDVFNQLSQSLQLLGKQKEILKKLKQKLLNEILG
ncbi:MAG: restriction endonuclease subunit S [Anaerolineales bacterium]|nr:restriction endonuclease subunit S [Anaerolineales bacterium]